MSSNNLGSSLSGSQKGKTIETDGFTIQGHLLRWEDVVIQISNISLVSSRNVPTPKFPIWAAIVALLGLWLFTKNTLLALIVLGVGGGAIVLWYMQYNRLKDEKCLHILLNSGDTFSLIARDVHFVEQVLGVFSKIFKDGDKAGTNYYIDMKNCKIANNSSVVQTNT